MIGNGFPVLKNIEKEELYVPIVQLLVDLEHSEISSFHFRGKFAVMPGGN